MIKPRLPEQVNPATVALYCLRDNAKKGGRFAKYDVEDLLWNISVLKSKVLCNNFGRFPLFSGGTEQ